MSLVQETIALFDAAGCCLMLDALDCRLSGAGQLQAQ
jgi:hypothetical protein